MPPTLQRFDSPESYTPKHLAERILTSKAALEGERKQVTVLFADLKGSMELLADRDPEEARKILDPVLERMMEAVHRYEGTVNQVMGDGIMALFGAPLAHEDHAVRACYAALRMQESVKKYAEEIHQTVGVALHIRVGVNSGEVVVRSIGSDLHMDYTAVGQTTHLAARLEQMAMPGSILISPATLNLAEGYVVVKPLGERPVKGLEAPLEVFEVVGAGTVRSRLQAAVARGLTRFVGRDAELEQLRQALEGARTGHGQVVAVVGEPGVGKSRLFWEFTHSHRIDGWLTVESSSVSYGKATAFLPLIELLRGYFQIEARDEARTIREKLTGKLLSLDRALKPSLPALLWLLDVPVDDLQWQRLDPPQRRQQTLDGIKRLLLRESQVQPLLLVFEDLHWIDAETQALLDNLVESLPTAQLLLLVTYRPEYQHTWGSKTYYRQLRIDPLSPESAEELLKVLLGNDPGLQPLTRLLIERTEGNPFFLEESVRTLVETKVLAGERGAYHLAKASASFQIPATAQAILAARIDRLAPEDKRLLQAASVIGKDVPFGLLQAITELSEDALRRGLTQLQAAEFLYEARLFPDLEYTFKHALTHEVAYGSLLQDRRRGLHARIMETIERQYADRLAEQVDRLAHHALRGEVWPRAVAYLHQAGARAAARSAYREAVTDFEHALAALAHLPESRETIAEAIDIRLELQGPLGVLGQTLKILDHLSLAEGLAAGLDDRSRLARVLASECYHLRRSFELDRAAEAGERALTIATDLGDLDLQVIARYGLGPVFLERGDLVRARDSLRWVIDALDPEVTSQTDPRPTHGPEGLEKKEAREGRLPTLVSFEAQQQRMGLGWGPTSILVRPHAWLTQILGVLGEFVEGISLGERAVRIAESGDQQLDRIMAGTNLGILYLTKGDLDRAIPLLEHSLAVARTWGIVGWLEATKGVLGAAYAMSGRHDEAFRLLQEALELGKQVVGQVHSSRPRQLGQVYLLAGHPAEASERARQALDLSRHRKLRSSEASALQLLGQAASHRDRFQPGEAEEYYRQALALAGKLGMRPLIAQCHLDLGQLYRRTGKRQQAQEHLMTATAMFREMDMTYWLEKAEGEAQEI